ncbi:MAG: ABC transporter permease [Lachnospirales bacterium]
MNIKEISINLKKEQRELRIRNFLSNYSLIIGSVVILFMILVAVFAPFIIKQDPYEMVVANRLMAPSREHIMGTDEFGRDLFARVVYGSRVSVFIGLVVALISSVFGLIIGLYASYYKILDNILMRICDGLIAIPGILLAIALMAALGASSNNVIIALTIVYIPSVARIVRSSALVVKEQTFIKAAYAQGASHFRILWGDIAPNILSPLIVQATFIFASAILSEAALSFLGAGIPDPEASWGNILQASKLVISKAWWMAAFPGLMLIVSVLSLNLFGDGLRDFLDPRLKSIPRKNRKKGGVKNG